MSFEIKFVIIFLSGFALGMYVNTMVWEKEINKICSVRMIGGDSK